MRRLIATASLSALLSACNYHGESGFCQDHSSDPSCLDAGGDSAVEMDRSPTGNDGALDAMPDSSTLPDASECSSATACPAENPTCSQGQCEVRFTRRLQGELSRPAIHYNHVSPVPRPRGSGWWRGNYCRLPPNPQRDRAGTRAEDSCLSL